MTSYDAASPASPSHAEIADLTAQIAGPVLLPDSAGYQAECATFNRMTPVRPALAIGATSAADVQAAIRFATERDLPVAVLATGHQVAHPAEGAILINMSRMNAVHIDPARNLCRVAGGARWQQVLDESDKYDLAPVSGASPTVGVVGYHLGGGHSPILGRTHGYAADHVQAIEIITADGQLREVTASCEPDLFWALLGGNGNFGVVTAMEFTLFPVSRFYGGGLFFAGEHAAKVLHAWREWVTSLPIEMTSSIAFLRRPLLSDVPKPLRGNFVIHVRFSSLRPREVAERLLAPIRTIAPTVLDTIAEHRYCMAHLLHMDPSGPAPWVERSTVLRDFPKQGADVLLSVIGPGSGTQLGIVELRALGGALERPPAVPNAVSGRNVGWALIGAGAGSGERTSIFQEQLDTLVSALAPWTQEERISNLVTPSQGTTQDEMRAIYGSERYNRLVRIKKHYDPRNLFRMNHNIMPA